jgi:hypothetical protein
VLDNFNTEYGKDFIKVSYNGDMVEIMDNGGRRAGIDRRSYSYTSHIPERRNGVDRRIKEDRRIDAMGIVLNNTLKDIERRKWN